MKVEVSAGIEELKRQFPESPFTAREDGQGGVYVIIEAVNIGPRFRPEITWFGFHIPPLYPYADIYPVFIGPDVIREDGVPFTPPVTHGANFDGRQAIQISRRNGVAGQGLQKATAKILKVIDFLERMP